MKEEKMTGLLKLLEDLPEKVKGNTEDLEAFKVKDGKLKFELKGYDFSKNHIDLANKFFRDFLNQAISIELDKMKASIEVLESLEFSPNTPSNSEFKIEVSAESIFSVSQTSEVTAMLKDGVQYEVGDVVLARGLREMNSIDFLEIDWFSLDGVFFKSEDYSNETILLEFSSIERKATLNELHEEWRKDRPFKEGDKVYNSEVGPAVIKKIYGESLAADLLVVNRADNYPKGYFVLERGTDLNYKTRFLTGKEIKALQK